MKLELNPRGCYIKEGKFDQYEALKDVGVRAALCFKETVNNEAIAPSDIRNSESDAILINRGVGTIYSDHTTPSEHQNITLELTGIPKILCMILNNEKQYSADERSLRYTEVEPNEYITEKEKYLYDKWLSKLENIIWNEYGSFYMRDSKENEARARKAVHKIAQENARYMVSVFMPTSISYTVPWIQINKIMVYMKRIVDNPMNELEIMLVPYLKEFIHLCTEKNVTITKNSIYEVANRDSEVKEKLYKTHPEIKEYCGSNEFIYKNNKNVDLSLFAYRNKFSGINSNNEYGYTISYNNFESWACLAQEHRHRTIDCEMLIPERFYGYIPQIFNNNYDLVNEWINDINSVKNVYPQGQMIKVNRIGSLKSIIKFVSQERACSRAQLEIERSYTSHIIPTIYDELEKKEDKELVKVLKPYVHKLRCQYPDYHCPSPCANRKLNRKI